MLTFISSSRLSAAACACSDATKRAERLALVCASTDETRLGKGVNEKQVTHKQTTRTTPWPVQDSVLL